MAGPCARLSCTQARVCRVDVDSSSSFLCELIADNEFAALASRGSPQDAADTKNLQSFFMDVIMESPATLALIRS